MGRVVKMLAVVAAAALLLGACGEEGGDGGAGKAVTVTAEDFAFSPTPVDLDSGEEVELTFENSDDVAHSFTIDDPSFELEAEGGNSTSGTFTAPSADVEFYCKFHPDQMKGLIDVGGEAAGGGTETETETDTETETETSPDDMTEGDNENDTGTDYDY